MRFQLMNLSPQRRTWGINMNYANGYIGTYYSENSRGIYRFLFDAEHGGMTEPELFYEARNAKWVSLSGGTMVFPIEKQGRAGVCFLELKEEGYRHATEILEEKETPCYIRQKGDFIYTANYHEGNVMVYRLEKGAPSLVKRIEHGIGAGCHQILLHEAFLMVPCLAQDRITMFDTLRGYVPAGEIVFPKGSGPRHGVFNREHTKLYMVSELSNELFVFRVQGREFILMESLPLLPEGRIEEHRNYMPEDKENKDSSERKGNKTAVCNNVAETAAAAIRLTSDGSFLYISLRGINALVVLDVRGDAVTVIQHISCGGDHPRDFILSEDERFLLVANRFKGGIVCMERDSGNGLLRQSGYRTAIPECVSLVFAPQKPI